jgi:hypothetical protein
MSVAACLAPAVLVADQAAAASYFCEPKPIKLGSYRPDDADKDLDIRLTLPVEPFWFDDQTGDYQAEGEDGPELGKLAIPIESAPNYGSIFAFSLPFKVRVTFEAGQCVASAMGVHPTKTNEATESMTK